MTKDNGPIGAARLKQEATALSKSLGKALVAWWYEHGAHLKQAGELHELEKQTAGNISQLQAQAAAAVREANQGRARQIVELEMARQKSERDAATLHQRLAALQADQQAQAQKVAALPTPEVARRVAARLGLGPSDLETRDSGFGVRGSDETRDSGVGIRDSGKEKSLSSEPRVPSPEPRIPNPGSFALSDAALRQVETALVELDGCKQQAQVRDNLL